MNEHRINMLARRLAVLLFASLIATPALAQSGDTDEPWDPNPDGPRGHVDIPEIGMNPPGGSPDISNTRDQPFFGWDIFTDGSGDIYSSTHDYPNYLLPSDPGDLIGSNEPISSEDILGSPVSSDLGGVNLDPVGTIPSTTGDLTPRSSDFDSPISSSGVPTPGSGVLVLGGLMLLGGRRRRR